MVAVNSSALFDTSAADAVFRSRSVKDYEAYMRRTRNNAFAPGVAFALISRMLSWNKFLVDMPVQVVILSKNNPESRSRITTSIQEHGLPIQIAGFTKGQAVSPYLAAFEVDMFLSTDMADVQAAHNEGIASAQILTESCKLIDDDSPLNVVFDADCVLVGEEAQRIYDEQGLKAFMEHERRRANEPLPKGPFAGFLHTLNRVQAQMELDGIQGIETAIVTARSLQSGERLQATFDAWEVSVDKAFFMSGMRKDKLVEALGPHLYLDDGKTHVERSKKSSRTAQVPRNQS